MNKFKFILSISLFLFSGLMMNNKVYSQDTQQPPKDNTTLDVSPQLDSKLTGEWVTDSRNANFAKIQFGSDGSFSGYTFSTDKTPFASGTYQIINGGIYIASTITDASMNKGDAVSMNYTFQSYIIKDNKLQLNMTDRKATYDYTKTQSK
jgi:hypothetical protein